MPKFKVDGFLIVLLFTITLASLLPVQGQTAAWFDLLTDGAIAALFFFHGAKLSRSAIIDGISIWRVHLAVLLATFVIFPLVGLALRSVAALWLAPTIGAGVLLMALMPSTVQSSIAFTAMARGNVPAAVCSASVSNLLGIFITPLLVGMFLSHQGGGLSSDAALKIFLQLLLPFVAGHACRPLLQAFLDRHKTLLAKADRGVIVLVVYTAFSAAVVEGLWHRYSIADLGWTLLIDALILAVILLITTFGARRLGFSTADEIVVVFCGSKKSLASGVPIAGALFPPAMIGPLILPLMLFHQLQLMACSVLAQRYAARSADGADGGTLRR